MENLYRVTIVDGKVEKVSPLPSHAFYTERTQGTRRLIVSAPSEKEAGEKAVALALENAAKLQKKAREKSDEPKPVKEKDEQD